MIVLYKENLLFKQIAARSCVTITFSFLHILFTTALFSSTLVSTDHMKLPLYFLMLITFAALIVESLLIYMMKKADFESVKFKYVEVLGYVLFLTWASLVICGYKKNQLFMKYILIVGEYLIITRGFMQFKFLKSMRSFINMISCVMYEMLTFLSLLFCFMILYTIVFLVLKE